MTLAQAIETATKDAQLMQPQSAPIQTVQDNMPQQGDPRKKPCYRCATKLVVSHSQTAFSLLYSDGKKRRKSGLATRDYKIRAFASKLSFQNS